VGRNKELPEPPYYSLKILILDEATNSIDYDSEILILKL